MPEDAPVTTAHPFFIAVPVLRGDYLWGGAAESHPPPNARNSEV